jgi:ribosomal subunit interface protein
MRVELTGRHLPISPSLRNLINRKVAKLERLLNDVGVSAAIIVTKERLSNVVEITLHARGERFLHAVAKAETWETATTTAVAKVLHQADKMKGKWHERKRRGPAARSVKRPKVARRATARVAAPATGERSRTERASAPAARPARTARVRR